MAVVPFSPHVDDVPVRPTQGDAESPLAARWWLAALDGRALGSGAERWTVRVAGMHLDGQDLWIQLQSEDDPSQGFVLHVVRGAPWYEAMCQRRT